MIKRILLSILLLPLLVSAQDQGNMMLEAIKSNQILSFGGCDLIKINDTTYLAGVSAVETGNKKISSLVRIGKVKAEREISTFINGSNITSSAESYMKEELITLNDTTYVNTVDTFVEHIREDSEGFVKSMLPAGFWYSDDRSVFFYALYKKINF
jgi:hypothetical protein